MKPFEWTLPSVANRTSSAREPAAAAGRRRSRAFVGAALVASTFAPLATAQSLNIDVGTANAAPANGYGAAAPSTGAWNQVSAVTGSSSLVKLDGTAATGVSITPVPASFDFASANPATTGDAELLLDDCEDVGGANMSTIWTISGLTNGTYDVYVYAWAPDNPINFFTSVTVAGGNAGAQLCGGADWGGAYVLGVQYVKDTVSVTNGALVFEVATAAGFGSFNGVQIVAASCSSTYTTGADFDQGFRMNLHNAAPDGNSYLTLNPRPEPIPLVWVACSGRTGLYSIDPQVHYVQRNTVVRIDADTGEVQGEYRTCPENMSGDPSRTTVDKEGNVWVANRAEQGFVGSVNKGSVTRIGLVIGGTRGHKVNGSFVADPSGSYLMGPFLHCTARDRDGDGLIHTSRGLGDVLSWLNTTGTDTYGGTQTADDECITFYTRVDGTNVRTMAIDPNGDLWTGGLTNQKHHRIRSSTGTTIGGSFEFQDAGGYGGLIDCRGRLWSAKGSCSTTSAGVLVYDPASGSAQNLGVGLGDYGLGIDPRTGEVWCTKLGWRPFPGTCGYLEPPSTVFKLDASGATPVAIGSYPHGGFNAQGCAVDANDNVWVAHSILDPDDTGPLPVPSTVGRLRASTGAHIGNVELTLDGTNFGRGPTGVAVDTNQKVWVTCRETSDVWRIDPNDTSSQSWSTAAGTVDLRVDLNVGYAAINPAAPYNYSDMTGYVLLGVTAPSGFWRVVKDSGQDNTSWGTLSYIGSLMAGTGMKIEVRAANLETQLAAQYWTNVSSGGNFGACGRYLEIRVSMWRDPCSDPNATPRLDELTVNCVPGPCPTIYCTAGTTSNGCLGDITSFGQPSLYSGSQSGASFPLTVTNVEGQKTGVIFYGITGPAAAPWGNGSSSYLCVKSPTQRTPAQSSGGTSGQCDGSFTLDWYAFQNANPTALGNPWSAGDKLYLQAWFRDPPAPKTTNLSNALELTYQP